MERPVQSIMLVLNNLHVDPKECSVTAESEKVLLAHDSETARDNLGCEHFKQSVASLLGLTRGDLRNAQALRKLIDPADFPSSDKPMAKEQKEAWLKETKKKIIAKKPVSLEMCLGSISNTLCDPNHATVVDAYMAQMARGSSFGQLSVVEDENRYELWVVTGPYSGSYDPPLRSSLDASTLGTLISKSAGDMQAKDSKQRSSESTRTRNMDDTLLCAKSRAIFNNVPKHVNGTYFQQSKTGNLRQSTVVNVAYMAAVGHYMVNSWLLGKPVTTTVALKETKKQAANHNSSITGQSKASCKVGPTLKHMQDQSNWEEERLPKIAAWLSTSADVDEIPEGASDIVKEFSDQQKLMFNQYACNLAKKNVKDYVYPHPAGKPWGDWFLKGIDIREKPDEADAARETFNIWSPDEMFKADKMKEKATKKKRGGKKKNHVSPTFDFEDGMLEGMDIMGDEHGGDDQEGDYDDDDDDDEGEEVDEGEDEGEEEEEERVRPKKRRSGVVHTASAAAAAAAAATQAAVDGSALAVADIDDVLQDKTNRPGTRSAAAKAKGDAGGSAKAVKAKK